MSLASDPQPAPRKIDFEAGRRTFLRTSGLAAAGAAVLGLTGFAPEAEAQTLSDQDILNFALNLEYLEAEFYTRATRGTGLAESDTTGTGLLGTVRGGSQVPFETKLVREFAMELAYNEENHVRVVRSTLGSAAIARPPVDLDSSFSGAALAAGLIVPGQRFNPFENENNFLLAGFLFEEVGVTAYKGAARFIANKDILEASAGILAVEAYQSGVLRTLLFERGFIDPANLISKTRDNLAGTAADQGITISDPSSPMAGQANLVPADANSIAFGRTPQQVLNIVYQGSTPNPLSFLPAGANGRIR